MFYPVVFYPVFYQVRTRVGFGVFGMGSARVRRTVRGVGPPARGEIKNKKRKMKSEKWIMKNEKLEMIHEK